MMMNIRLYQISSDRDRDRRMFMPLGRSDLAVNAYPYDLVFDGVVDAASEENVFHIFNVRKPHGFRGRSMSVSDVLGIKDDAGRWRYLYCDSVGFTPVIFDSRKAGRI